MRYFNVLLFVGFTFANMSQCMEDSANAMVKRKEAVAQLRLCDLPIEILNYIASFLTFPYEETDEEFERRLRIHKVSNNVQTPAGNIFYSKNGSRPGFYIKDKSQKIYRLINSGSTQEEIPLHAFSSNNKYLIVASKNNNKTEVVVCDIRKKKINCTEEFTGGAKNCAIADNGDCYAVIWNENNGTAINFYDVPYEGFKRIFSKNKFNVMGFNKQFTKFAYVTKQGKFLSIDIAAIISKPLRKTLSKYFRLMGVCKNFPYYVEKKPSFFAVKNYNRHLANFY